MLSVFKPAIALMNRLKYPQKFLLVGLMLVLPLALALSQFIVQINKDITFSSKEQLGARYNAPLFDFLVRLQEYTDPVVSYHTLRENLQRVEDYKRYIQEGFTAQQYVTAVDRVDALIGADLDVSTKWASLKQKWEKLKSDALTLDLPKILEAHSALINDTLTLINDVGNNSNLILDPDIDSYYLMDSTINKLPALVNYVGQIQAYIDSAGLNERFTSEEKTRLIILLGLADTTWRANLRGFDYTIAFNPSLRISLQTEIDANTTALNRLIDSLRQDYLTQAGDTRINVTQYSDLKQFASTVQTRTSHLNLTVTQELARLLQVRINIFEGRRNLIIGVTIIGVTLAVYLFWGIYLTIQQTIGALEKSSERMVRGHFGEAVVLANRDELAQVANAFNNVATELITARDRALEASKAKSTFLANMSHELRTPLNAIIGYGELLEEECEDAGHNNYIPDLKKIQAAAKHLLGLINDILDLSKIEAGKAEMHLEDFETVVMVRDVVTTVTPLINKNNNTLVLNMPDAVGIMRADLTKIRQVLFNLLSNASKFTKEGTITFDVVPEMVEGTPWIRFAVTDSGIGISPEQMARLFQEFSQGDASTTRKFGGTGLGLAISRRFCQMMGGDITVVSEANKGSTFTVRLPRLVVKPDGVLPELPDTGQLRDIKEAPPGASTILVIDDDPTVHELMRRFLSKEGFRVETAPNGLSGLRMAKELMPQVIILDVMMPGMDGWSVLGRLKNDPELASIPVVLATMLNDKDMGYTLGASDFMTKPIQRDMLLAVLDKYLCKQAICKVLVVEDDDPTRETVVRTLSKEGYQVHEARNGREGLVRMAADLPGLILLDLMMPEMDGFQFIAEVQKQESWLSIPIVVVTAMDLSEEDRQRLTGQVHRIIQKGAYKRDELLNEIKRLVMRLSQEVPRLENTSR